MMKPSRYKQTLCLAILYIFLCQPPLNETSLSSGVSHSEDWEDLTNLNEAAALTLHNEPNTGLADDMPHSANLQQEQTHHGENSGATVTQLGGSPPTRHRGLSGQPCLDQGRYLGRYITY